MLDKKLFSYAVEFEPTEIITKGVKKHLIKGYFSTIDEDLSTETVTIDAQKDILAQVKGRTITLDAEHEIFYGSDGKPLPKPSSNIPLGKVIDAELDLDAKYGKKGVYGTVELNSDAPRFKNIWSSILKGFLHSFSVAFYPIEAVKQKVKGVFKSFVNKLNLINITLTGAPMNPNATFVPVMKSALNSMDSFDTYDLNHNNEVYNMTETELKNNPQEDEVKKDEVKVKKDEVKDQEVVEEVTEESKESDVVKETPEVETKSKEIDLKSMIASLKSEFSKDLESLKSDYAKSLEEAKEGFNVELKSLKEQITKLENQPIKKSLKADASSILGKKEEYSVFNLM